MNSDGRSNASDARADHGARRYSYIDGHDRRDDAQPVSAKDSHASSPGSSTHSDEKHGNSTQPSGAKYSHTSSPVSSPRSDDKRGNSAQPSTVKDSHTSPPSSSTHSDEKHDNSAQPSAAKDSPSPSDAHRAAPSSSEGLSGMRVRLQGRSLERLLHELQAHGVHPREVRREGLRTLTMRIERSDEREVRRACADAHVEVRQCTPLGLTRALMHLRRRAALPICAALCVLMLGMLGTRIWRIDVEAPSHALRAQVEQALSALGAMPGAAKSGLDLRALESAVTADVPGVKFCQARVRGVTLTLTAQQVEPAPDTLSLYPPGGLYALCDAVVERVQVLAGRAVVQRGDTVRAGDLLISGEEQLSREDTAPVRALGIVTGRVWFEGRGEAALIEVALEPTGRQSLRRVMRLPGREIVLAKGREFALCRREVSEQPIGGLFVPVSIVTTRISELRERDIQRPMDEAKAIAQEKARQNAVKKCPDNANIIDKWTEYSIIEGNMIEARYIIEAELTIQRGA